MADIKDITSLRSRCIAVFYAFQDRNPEPDDYIEEQITYKTVKIKNSGKPKTSQTKDLSDLQAKGIINVSDPVGDNDISVSAPESTVDVNKTWNELSEEYNSGQLTAEDLKALNSLKAGNTLKVRGDGTLNNGTNEGIEGASNIAATPEPDLIGKSIKKKQKDKFIKKKITKKKKNFNNIMDAKKYIEDDLIVACTIAKDKSLVASKFQLTLKPRIDRDYKKILKPGDWIQIYLDDEGNINLDNRNGLKVVGTIDRISESKITKKNGEIEILYNVHGSGFGKVFLRTEMYLNPYFQKQQRFATLVKQGLQISGSPLDFVNAYIDAFLGDAKKQDLENVLFGYLIPPKLYADFGGQTKEKGSSVSFIDILTKDFNSNTDEGFILGRDLQSLFSGSLWNVLVQASNPAINEMYTDIKDNKPALVFRRIPKTKDQILNLAKSTINNKKYQIPEKLIVNSNLGLSEHELFNMAILYPTTNLARSEVFANAAIYPKKFPQIDEGYIKRYGLRRIERETEYGYSQGGAPDQNLLGTWIEELGYYWRNYWRMENGSFDILGKYDFEIGQFYKINETNKIYMVEGYQYSWKYGSPIVASISVTHGIYDDGSFVDEKESSQDLIGMGYFERQNEKKFDK